MLFCFCYFKSLICWFLFFCLSNKYYSRPHCFFLLGLDLHQMWHFDRCFPVIFNAFRPKLLKTSASDWKLRVAQLIWLRRPCHAAAAAHILQRSDTYTNTVAQLSITQWVLYCQLVTAGFPELWMQPYAYEFIIYISTIEQTGSFVLFKPSDVNSFQLVYLSNRSYLCLAWRQRQIEMWGVHQVKPQLTINRIISDSVSGFSCRMLPCTFEPERPPF